MKSGNTKSDYLFLGNINGSHCHDGYAGAVFDINGISPAVTTCQGGGREPHILLAEKTNGNENLYKEIICQIPVYANYNICDGFNKDYARTIMNRDYKGLGTGSQTSTCIVEISRN